VASRRRAALTEPRQIRDRVVHHWDSLASINGPALRADHPESLIFGGKWGGDHCKSIDSRPVGCQTPPKQPSPPFAAGFPYPGAVSGAGCRLSPVGHAGRVQTMPGGRLVEDKTLHCRDCGDQFVFTSVSRASIWRRASERAPALPFLSRDRRGRTTMPPAPTSPAPTAAQAVVPFVRALDRPVYCGNTSAQKSASPSQRPAKLEGGRRPTVLCMATPALDSEERRRATENLALP
jgi:hypothetical protein